MHIQVEKFIKRKPLIDRDNLKNVKITVKCTSTKENFEIELEKLVRIGG